MSSLKEVRKQLISNDFPLLADSLGILEIFKYEQRSVSNGMEALCMLLKRLAYPCQYSDIFLPLLDQILIAVPRLCRWLLLHQLFSSCISLLRPG